MKKLLQMLAFLLAISTGIALAQGGGGGAGGGGAAGGANGSGNSATNPGGAGATGGGNAASPDSASQTPSPASDQDNKNIKTHTDAVDDQTLHREIHEQLATNPDLQGVQVEVNNGVAKLSGSVPNKDDKKEAAKLVKSVAGVKKVKDNLTVASANGQAASPAAASQSDSNSTTGANNGSTSGTMNENPPSTQNPNNSPNSPNSPVPHNNFMPDQAASQSGSASSNAGASSAAESSDQVKNDIQTAFHNEPTLTSSNISVDVSDSKVTLSGTAPSEKDRDEARRIAQSFAGNRSMVDNVKVAGAGSPSSSSSSSASTPDASTTPNSAGSNAGSQSGTTPNNPEQPNTPKQ